MTTAVARAGLAALAVLTASCAGDTPTSPTTTTTTTVVVAAPAVTEEFTGTVPVGGWLFYSFSVTQYGTVNITLNSVSGAFVPSTVTMGLGVGVPTGEDCSLTASVSTKAGSSPQITGAYAAGVYCAKVWDVGNLFAPAQFSVSIAYP